MDLLTQPDLKGTSYFEQIEGFGRISCKGWTFGSNTKRPKASILIVMVLPSPFLLLKIPFFSSLSTSHPPTCVCKVHGNGFCKELWESTISHFITVVAAKYDRIVLTTVDLPGKIVLFLQMWSVWTHTFLSFSVPEGHGESDPFLFPLSWWDFGKLMVPLVSQTRARHGSATSKDVVLGLGHSLGATTLLMSQVPPLSCAKEFERWGMSVVRYL